MFTSTNSANVIITGPDIDPEVLRVNDSPVKWLGQSIGYCNLIFNIFSDNVNKCILHVYIYSDSL
jgi:hypothetical protein